MPYKDPEKAKARAHRYNAANRDTVLAAGRARRARNYWRYDLKKRYGITADDYLRMLSNQGGACAICSDLPVEGSRGRLYVDHCHKTGRTRGLLCKRCNMAIGGLKECRALFEAAIRYLHV